MIVVIQCAGSKRHDAGQLLTPSGKPVLFVAHPESAPGSDIKAYARPDDVADNGKTWRDVLLDYNLHPEENPCGLLPAYQLYRHRAYGRLVERFGATHVYILSAAWGLISASFLTPDYDITFSHNAEPYQRRRKGEKYRDFNMLPAEEDSAIKFVGGKDYVPLFCSLTSGARGERTVFFNSDTPPHAPGCVVERYPTSTRTNWHYECAGALVEGRVRLGGAGRGEDGPHPRPPRATSADRGDRMTKRAEISAVHVRRLIDDFDHYVQLYDRQFPFTRAEQASGHVRTLQLRARAGSARAAIGDPSFVQSLYGTLRAWGIGQRGSSLVPLTTFQARLLVHSEEIAQLDGMGIDDPALQIDQVARQCWQLIESLGIVENKAPLVAGTKALHHLLPDLVPPMDRAYTRPFFGWYSPQFQNQQQRVFLEAMRSFREIAVKVQPRRLQGAEWRTSLAKILDNAVVAFVIENKIQRS